MKIESLGVIVKLDNNNFHQILLSKSEENLVLNLIQQLHNNVIKFNTEKLTTIDIEYV